MKQVIPTASEPTASDSSDTTSSEVPKQENSELFSMSCSKYLSLHLLIYVRVLLRLSVSGTVLPETKLRKSAYSF